MLHEEYVRIVPGSDTAVLFLHGILGSPKHFEDLIPLVPENVSVYALLLEGHGRGVRDFSAASMVRWQAQVEEKVQQLFRQYSKLLVAAHSMGTLFAIQQAIKNPQQISALFLLAVPLKVAVKPSMLSAVAKIYMGKIKPDDHMALATQRVCSVKQDKRFWLYLGWIPRYLELFSQIRKTRARLELLCVPCWAYQSQDDEMVGVSSVEILKMNQKTKVNVLNNSSHNYYSPEDKGYLLSQFSQWLEYFA